MAISTNNIQGLITKKMLFEFLVCELDNWRINQGISRTDLLTKLRLQKILFFVASVKATSKHHPLLDIFNNFYALPYGPVEIDIYEYMNNNEFQYLSFNSNDCLIGQEKKDFSSLNIDYRNEIIKSIEELRKLGANYINQPVFELVDITHKWSAWQIAMDFAKIMGMKKARMTTNDIISSSRYF